jgi:NAD(P)H-quinone oxidoreductase subunit 5
VVNAGGFLVIRLSGFLTHYPEPLLVLALVGTATVLVGGLVMMTQTSIKRSLAYSTVAQMGFMMLQCGLGAFSVAFFHIIAHSLYKAHAFLSSGSNQLSRGLRGAQVSQLPSWPSFAITAAVTVGLFATVLTLSGLQPSEKPGGWVLCAVISLAFCSAVWRALRTGRTSAVALSLASVVLLSGLYVVGYSMVDQLLQATRGVGIITPLFVEITAVSAFVLLFTVQQFAESPTSAGPVGRWISRMYVHVMNGFYVEAASSRLFGLAKTT